MRTPRLLAVVAVTAVSLAGAACGAAAASAPHAGQATIERVTIVGNSQLRFSPSVVHVHVGKVRVTLEDSGAYPHNIVIPKLKVDSSSVTGDPGGTKVTFTVDFRHPGRYSFHCEYHVSAGMVGTFVVSSR